MGGADGDAKDGIHDEGEAAGGLRGETAKVVSLVMRWPMVLMMRQPPAMGPPICYEREFVARLAGAAHLRRWRCLW
jgi:hypothetical protein